MPKKPTSANAKRANARFWGREKRRQEQQWFTKRAEQRRTAGVNAEERQTLRGEAASIASRRSFSRLLDKNPDAILSQVLKNLGQVPDVFSKDEHGAVFKHLGQGVQDEERMQKLLEDYSKKTVLDFSLFSPNMRSFLHSSPYYRIISAAREHKLSEAEISVMKKKLKILAASTALNAIAEFHGKPFGESIKNLKAIDAQVTAAENRGILSAPEVSNEEATSFLRNVFTLAYLDHVVKQTLLKHWEKATGNRLSKDQKSEIILTSPPVLEPLKFLEHARSTAKQLEEVEREREKEQREYLRKTVVTVEESLRANYALDDEEVRKILAQYMQKLQAGNDNIKAVRQQAVTAHNKKLEALARRPEYSQLDLVSRLRKIKSEEKRQQVTFKVVSAINANKKPFEIDAMIAGDEPELKTEAKPLGRQPVEPEKPDFSRVFANAGFNFTAPQKNKLNGILYAIQKKRPSDFENFLPALDTGLSNAKTFADVEKTIYDTRKELFGRKAGEPALKEAKAVETGGEVIKPPPVVIKEQTLSELLQEIDNTHKLTPSQIVLLKKLAVKPSASPVEKLESAKHIILFSHAQAGLEVKLPHEGAFADYLPFRLKHLTVEAVRQLKREGMLEQRSLGTAGRPALVVTRAVWHKYHPALSQ